MGVTSSLFAQISTNATIQRRTHVMASAATRKEVTSASAFLASRGTTPLYQMDAKVPHLLWKISLIDVLTEKCQVSCKHFSKFYFLLLTDLLHGLLLQCVTCSYLGYAVSFQTLTSVHIPINTHATDFA